MLSEKNTISQLQENSIEAYRKIFLQYYKQLCTEAFSILRDEATAEDIVQTVFINFWKDRKLNVITISIEAYLKAAVRNACINDIKRRKRESSNLQDYMLHHRAVDEKKPVELKEMSYWIEKALNNLPLQCRQTFELVVVERKKYEEAASLLGVSVNTVKTQLRRAYSKLREALYHFQE